MTIDQLAEKRKRGIEALRENNWEEGIKDLLSNLYPDTAHFIYELLQNAEDAQASEVSFLLTNDSIVFIHNGRLFSPDDVDAITSIGSSAKKDDTTNIGEFGIGFKAVFSYTLTPAITSGEYNFRIRDMVVPDTEGPPPAALAEGKTRFVFPFNNPEKPPQRAHEEIANRLKELNEDTLLFLSNIRKVNYYIHQHQLDLGFLELKETDGNRIEISVTHPEEMGSRSTYYLRFTKDITVVDADRVKNCRIAVAFGMKKREDEGWKITPLENGQVCIYFPAAKETSNLQFHLHAPFASTVARDSVRDDPANDILLSHLADLVAESMSAIRDQGLLDIEFLACLPNKADRLSPFYLPIKERLIEAFNNENLMPTQQGNHAPASNLYRGDSKLIKLIDDRDLATLLDRDNSAPQWVADPQLPQRRDESGRYVGDDEIRLQNQRIGNFLSMVDLCDWGVDDVIEFFKYESNRAIDWLGRKPEAWHQALYEWLGISVSGASSRSSIDELSNLRIVRCCDGIYRMGRECFLSSEDTGHEDGFHYVVKGVYTSGTSTDQKKNARKLLEDIGVSEVGEAERIEAILKQRYVKGANNAKELRKQYQKQDMERFITLVENNSDKASMFKDYVIFESDKDLDNKNWWRTPDGIFLDSPYRDTGLRAYHKIFDDKSTERKWGLSPSYKELGLDLERLGRFAQAVGVQAHLQVIEREIPRDHPEWKTRIQRAAAQRITNTSVNRDFSIPEFKDLIENPTIEKSKLIWLTMCSQHESKLKAQFRPHQNHNKLQVHSSLVHLLRNAAWVPQKHGDSYTFAIPCEASTRGLPHDFQCVTSWAWLKAVEFGRATGERKTEYIQLSQHVKEMGFDSVDEAETMAAIVKDLKAQGKSSADLEDFVGQMHHDGQRRQRLIIEDLRDAEEKKYEIVDRSSRVSRNNIDPRTYLVALYRSNIQTVECQMCGEPMPFKKRNSNEDYFEAVEALGTEYFPLEHVAQYLALCPECAAKYKEYVKRSKNAQKELYRVLKDSDESEVLLKLSEFTIRIQFEKRKHWQDIKTVVYYYENLYESED